MRLFAAIELSEEMKKAAVSVMHELKKKGIKGNYTPVQNLHITLCFIGEVSDSKAVEEALSNVSFKPFKFAFTDTGSFGDILYIGTRGGQGISRLAADIRKAFDEAGIDYDRKKFNPHITIVRKASANPGKINIPAAEMMVKKVSLFRSDRVKEKMVYTEIFSI